MRKFDAIIEFMDGSRERINKIHSYTDQEVLDAILDFLITRIILIEREHGIA